MMKKILAGALLLFFMLVSYATVYMHKDANNNISYSDLPNNNAQPIDIPNVSSSISTNNAEVAKPKEVPVQSSTEVPALPDKPGKLVYTDLAVQSPKDNDTFQNQPSIPVKLKVTPKLQDNDLLQLVVDGTLWGSPNSNTDFSLVDLPRGTHTISAVLMDDQQKVILSSNMVTIFNLKVTLNSPARAR